ncbi:arsR family transcriptional regulator [Burkholderia cepacia]|nr:arsR family transcriptional regulator [Burkholderia cepacia]
MLVIRISSRESFTYPPLQGVAGSWTNQAGGLRQPPVLDVASA